MHSHRRTVVGLFTHSWEDRVAHTFPKGIYSKVNIIARLEFELAYYDFAIHRFNHYTTRTPRISLKVKIIARREFKLVYFKPALRPLAITPLVLTIICR